MALVAISFITRIVVMAKKVKIQKKRLVYDRVLKEALSTRMVYIKHLEASERLPYQTRGHV